MADPIRFRDGASYDVMMGTWSLSVGNIFLADESVDVVDSCSFDDSGYMASWQERGEIATLWFDVRPRRSMTFVTFACLQSAWLAVRARAKAAYRKHLRKTGR